MGVITGDIDLTTMQELIRDIPVGQDGWAFMLDKKGFLIENKEGQNVMTTEIVNDSNPTFAELGRQMMQSGSQDMQQGSFTEAGETIRAYYIQIPETAWTLALAIPESELYAPLRKLLLRMVYIIAAAMFVITAIVVLFSRYITRNTRSINELSFALSQGDLTQSLAIRSQDEFGQMSMNFNQTLGTLQTLVGNIVQCSDNVFSSAEGLKFSAKETTRASEEIASSISSVASSIDNETSLLSGIKYAAIDISAGIGQIANSVETMSVSSATAKEAADRGNEMMSNMITHMNSIQHTVNDSANSVFSIKEKSEHIFQITALITDIAAQTHLLSLNAAIEAARAGEQGRGFSVVANEVKKLADESGAAAQRITRMIAEIQETIADAVRKMNSGTATVTSGIQVAGEAEVSFSRILQSIEKVADQSIEVSAAVEQMYSNTETVVADLKKIEGLTVTNANHSMQVAAASEEQNASMQEVAAAADQITDQALTLKQIVDQFQYQKSE